MNKHALIFGSGPAGMMAAHACYLSGYQPAILSYGNKSTMYGAQYLHEEIPELGAVRSTEITHLFKGTPDSYRAKVYGTDWDGIVSPQMFEGTQMVWDIRQAYDALWERYGGFVVKLAVTTSKLFEERVPILETYDTVISSIPARTLCGNPNHEFNSGKIFAIGDAPDRDQYSPIPTPDDTVVCNGDPNVSWYRSSKIFGHSTAEWPEVGRRRPPISGVACVEKPLRTTCDCFPWVNRVGRYGTWTKGVLSHDAYFDTVKKLSE